MKKLITLIFLLYSSLAFANSYNLPIQAQCNGQWNYAAGSFVCNQDANQTTQFKVKIPPTKGQIRVVNCNGDITADGNPDDFNTVTWKTGWWFWRRTHIIYAETPIITLPTNIANECAIVVSVTGENTGTQNAVLLYHTDPKLNDFMAYKCGESDWLPTQKGVGSCHKLTGAIFSVKIPVSEPSVVNLKGCNLQKKIPVDKASNVIEEVVIQQDSCVLDVQKVTTSKDERSRFLLIGKDRTLQELDSPTMIAEGTSRRVIKPLSASLILTEYYINNSITWRVVKIDDNYLLKPDDDGWDANNITCHTAYFNTTGSISRSCYNMRTLQEVPQIFK